MAIEYVLILAGRSSVDQVAERASAEPDDRPTGNAPLLSVDLTDRRGFTLTVRSGPDRYVSAQGDAGWWEWEPAPFVSLTFRLDKAADLQRSVLNMLPFVRRVLDSGGEDAAFVQNGDNLLFTRLNGTLVKHHRDDWWAYYDGADQVV
ncbi:hypothetical protein KOI35_35615 [Actinoplanes bogorensis]|uniref:Uncharacterized protein n=1 Tax=Paractinoplanes bogorensis TaxID=1610840 RepID=A0ABS5YZJ2_9ACTN|nr:SitI3 family protein [Actinoplanes bogorensis]MBU2668852.1 hypothetical protein [Actinoplanes bogorensis]